MDLPAHVGGHLGGYHLGITAVLALSAVATVVLCSFALVTYRRRRSLPYLLVLLALTALVARPVVGVLSSVAVVSADTHHVLEHALDSVFVGLLLGAVYYARTVEKRLDEEEI